MLLSNAHIEIRISHPKLKTLRWGKMSFRKIAILLLLLIAFQSYTQPISEQLQAYVDQLHQTHSGLVPTALKEERNAMEIVEAASSYFNDTLSLVRGKMYSLVGDVAVKSNDQNLREQAVQSLVNVAMDLENLDLILVKLSAFRTIDFSQTSREGLITLFKENTPYRDQLVRLIGTLQITELSDELRVISNTTTNSQRLRWAALLVLAHMNDADAIQSVMKKVQRLPVNDDVVYEIFPDLIYTQQRQAIDYLIVELNSDEKKCFTADAEDETPITCAYRIMEMLAPVIEKYPLELDASGDIKTKDYKNSLATVRTWFEKNKDYELVK